MMTSEKVARRSLRDRSAGGASHARRASRRGRIAGAALVARTAFACAALFALPSGQALASESYPVRPVKVVVPQPPGGGFDFVGRLLGEHLGRELGQTFIVENRPGSGTLVGTDAVAKSEPDGYTLLVGSVSNIALNPGLYSNLPYDSLRDFKLLGLAASYSYTLIARNSLPQSSLKEVIAEARANPRKLTYASAGNGSGQHVIAAALWHLAGVELVHVPYRGAQAAYQDLLGDRVDLFFDLAPTASRQIAGGRAKPLATSGGARNPAHPDLPTIRESGAADLELESWFGLFAPAKTPPEVTERLRAALAKVAANPEVQEALRKAGGRPLTLQPEQARSLVEGDVKRWSKLVKDIGIRLD